MDPRRVHQYPDGWSIRQLHTYADAEREGRLMNNCFAFGSTKAPHPIWLDYPGIHREEDDSEPEGVKLSMPPEAWKNLDTPLPTPLYSLRDPENLPHVSIDPQANLGSEALGAHNSPVKPEYLQRLAGWPQWDASEGGMRDVQAVTAPASASAPKVFSPGKYQNPQGQLTRQLRRMQEGDVLHLPGGYRVDHDGWSLTLLDSDNRNIEQTGFQEPRKIGDAHLCHPPRGDT